MSRRPPAAALRSGVTLGALAALLVAAPACGDALSSAVESANRRSGRDSGPGTASFADDRSMPDAHDASDADSSDVSGVGGAAVTRYQLCFHPEFARQGEVVDPLAGQLCPGATPPPWDCSSAWLSPGGYEFGHDLYVGTPLDVLPTCELQLKLLVDGLAAPGEYTLSFSVHPAGRDGGVAATPITLWGYFSVLRAHR